VTTERDRELLHDYLDGRVTADERERIEERLASDPTLAALHRELATVLATMRALRDERAPDGFAESVMDSIERGSRRPRWLGPALAIAAGFVVTAIGMRLWLAAPAPETVAAPTLGAAADARAAADREEGLTVGRDAASGGTAAQSRQLDDAAVRARADGAPPAPDDAARRGHARGTPPGAEPRPTDPAKAATKKGAQAPGAAAGEIASPVAPKLEEAKTARPPTADRDASPAEVASEPPPAAESPSPAPLPPLPTIEEADAQRAAEARGVKIVSADPAAAAADDADSRDARGRAAAEAFEALRRAAAQPAPGLEIFRLESAGPATKLPPAERFASLRPLRESAWLVIADVIAAAPESWRPALRALAAADGVHVAAFRVRSAELATILKRAQANDFKVSRLAPGADPRYVALEPATSSLESGLPADDLRIDDEAPPVVLLIGGP
jgi:hypothetical protein